MLQQVELYIQAAERELSSASKSLFSLQHQSFTVAASSRGRSGNSDLVSSPGKKLEDGTTKPFSASSSSSQQQQQQQQQQRRSTSPSPEDPLDKFSTLEKGEAVVSFGTKAIGLLREAINTFVDDVRNWQDDNATLAGASGYATPSSSVASRQQRRGYFLNEDPTFSSSGGGAAASYDKLMMMQQQPAVSTTSAAANNNRRLLVNPPSSHHHLSYPLSAPSASDSDTPAARAAAAADEDEGERGDGRDERGFRPHHLTPSVDRLRRMQQHLHHSGVAAVTEEVSSHRQDRDYYDPSSISSSSRYIGVAVVSAQHMIALNRAMAKMEGLNSLATAFRMWEQYVVERRLLRRIMTANQQQHQHQHHSAAASPPKSLMSKKSGMSPQKQQPHQQQQQPKQKDDDGDENGEETVTSAMLATTDRLVDFKEGQLTRLRMLHRWSIAMFRRQYDFASHVLNRRVVALDKVVSFNARLRDQSFLRRKVTHIFFVWCMFAMRRVKLRTDAHQLLESHRGVRSLLLEASRAHFANLWHVAKESAKQQRLMAMMKRELQLLGTTSHHQLQERQQHVGTATSSSSAADSSSSTTPPPHPSSAAMHSSQQQPSAMLADDQQQQQGLTTTTTGTTPHHLNSATQQQVTPPMPLTVFVSAPRSTTPVVVPAAANNNSSTATTTSFELSWEDWEWHRANAFACELLFEVHESVRQTLLQCSATTTACHYLVFRSAVNELLESGGSISNSSTQNSKKKEGGAGGAGGAGDDGDIDALREAYASLLRHNAKLRKDMRSIEGVNSGLQVELLSSNQDRALLRRQQSELELFLSEAQHREVRVRDHCVLAFLLSASSVSAFIDATEIKSAIWLDFVEQLHLVRLIETERQIEGLQEEMLKHRSPSPHHHHNNNQDQISEPALVDVSALDPEFDLSDPRKVWALVGTVRRRATADGTPAAAAAAAAPSPSALSPASSVYSSPSASPVKTTVASLVGGTADDASSSAVALIPVGIASSSHNGDGDGCDKRKKSAVLRVDALSMLLAAHRAFSTWKNAVISKFRDEAAERTESADVAWARLDTLTQKHGEAMAQLRLMEKSVASMKRDVALCRSADRIADNSNTADGYVMDSLSPEALMDFMHHQDEIDLVIRARCFRRWATWCAAKLRQRVYENAQATTAEASADAADQSIMSAWAYEVAASASGVVSSTQVTPARNSVMRGEQQQQILDTSDVAASPLLSPSHFV